MSRSHIYETIQTVDPVSLTVRVIPGASVALATLQTLWSAEEGGTALTNPMVADSRGVIEAWTDQPERIPYTASLSGFVAVSGFIESQRDDAEDAAVGHTHNESDIPSLVSDLNNKSNVGHTHGEGDVAGLAADLANKAAAIHSHAEGDVAGLAADLASKANASHTHLEGDLTDATGTPTAAKIPIADANGKLDGWISNSTTTTPGKVQLSADGGTTAGQVVQASDSRMSNARTPTAHATTHQPGGTDAMAVDAVAATGSLRTLGTGAQQAAAGNHAHDASAITTGTVATARLGSGTADGTTYLRGDQTYSKLPVSIYGATLSNSAGVGVGNYLIARIPASRVGTAIKLQALAQGGGGTNISYNFRKNGTLQLHSGDITLAPSSGWVTSVSLINASLAADDYIELQVTAVTGVITQFSAQLEVQ